MEPIELELGPLKDPLRSPYLHRKIAFSADNKYLAISGRQEGEAAFAWELPGGRKLAQPQLFGNSFLEFIGNSHLLMGDAAKIWDVPGNDEVTTSGGFRPEAGVSQLKDSYFDHCMDLNPSGTLLLGAPLHDRDYYYYGLGMWDVGGGNFLRRYDTPRVKFNNSKVTFLPDGQLFVFAAQLEQSNKTLNITSWEIASGKKVTEINLQVGMDDFNFDFSPDGTLLIVADKTYELESGQLQPVSVSVASERPATTFANKTVISRDLALVSPNSGELYVKDMSGKIVETLKASYERRSIAVDGHEEQKLQPRVMGASRDGTYYAAGDNRKILVWQASSVGRLDGFTGHRLNYDL